MREAINDGDGRQSGEIADYHDRLHHRIARAVIGVGTIGQKPHAAVLDYRIAIVVRRNFKASFHNEQISSGGSRSPYSNTIVTRAFGTRICLNCRAFQQKHYPDHLFRNDCSVDLAGDMVVKEHEMAQVRIDCRQHPGC